MAKERIFLDTSILLNWDLRRSIEADKIMSDSNLIKFTNEHVLKEIYWVLKNQFKYNEHRISEVKEKISNICTILPTPSKEEYIKINIRDKSDRPMVCAAMKHDLILYIDDEKTYRDAKKYVKVKRICKNGE